MFFWRISVGFWHDHLATLVLLVQKLKEHSFVSIVIMDDPRNACEAGFTDPLLAKQKQHSKKAFELIGKALRLDEENKHGMYDHHFICRELWYVFLGSLVCELTTSFSSPLDD